MTTWKTEAPASRRNDSRSSLSGVSNRMVASAPSCNRECKPSGFRPAPTTRPAPYGFANLTASLPVTPVAPKIRTLSPDINFARYVSDSHADMPGFGRAAALSSLRAAGTGKTNALGTIRRTASAKEHTLTDAKLSHPIRAADKGELPRSRVVRPTRHLHVHGLRAAARTPQ